MGSAGLLQAEHHAHGSPSLDGITVFYHRLEAPLANSFCGSFVEYCAWCGLHDLNGMDAAVPPNGESQIDPARGISALSRPATLRTR